MKKTAYNSFLVLILAFLLLSPVGAFGFVGKQSDDPAVLGIVSVPETPNVNVKVMDQVDLTLNLSDHPVQKFYNVVPEKYQEGNYQILVVVPRALQEQGFSAKLIQNQMTFDLLVTVSPNAGVTSAPITLLVLQ